MSETMAFVTAVSGTWAGVLANAVVKGTGLLLIAMGVSALLRRRAADVHHMLWGVALGGMLMLPALSSVLPTWRVSGFPSVARSLAPGFRAEAVPIAPAAVNGPAASVLQSVSTVPPKAGAATVNVPVPPAPVAPSEVVRYRLSLSPAAWMVLAWLVGAGLIALHLLVGLTRVGWIGRTASPADERTVALADTLARELRIRRRVSIRQRPGAMPMTWGVFSPVILLPAEFGRWSLARRRDVLLHELAHVRRFDVLTQLLARLACAVYWFHPLVWVGAERLRAAREQACDDCVLAAGAKASDYATHLLDLARALRPVGATGLVSVAMARPSQLAGRLLAVLDGGRRHGTTRGLAGTAWTAAALVLVPLAALGPVDRTAHQTATSVSSSTGSSAGQPEGRAGLTISTASPLRSQGQGQGKGLGQGQGQGQGSDGCMDGSSSASVGSGSAKTSTTHSHSSSDIEDDWMRVSWTSGDCHMSLDVHGKVTFTDDETDVKTLSDGGTFELQRRAGGHTWRLTVDADGGALKRGFSIDGDAQPYDARATAFMASVLPEVFRRTGINAAERVQRILAKSGPEGVLDEIARVHSDYVRRLYYTELLKSRRLDNAMLQRVVVQAGQSISSDYDLAELLIAIAKDYPLNSAARSAYIAASRNIQSDYDRHRVLSVVLSSGDLDTPALSELLASAGDIKSDYDMAELLVQVADRYTVNDTLRAAFFAALGSVSSDYDRGRVLESLLKKTPATPAVVHDVLASSKGLGSDYTRAQVLMQVTNAGLVTVAVAPDYFAAVNAIGSGYSRHQALSALLAHHNLDPVVVKGVIASAAGIGSGYDKAELLIEVVRTQTLDAALRDQLTAVANAIGSSYDRDRVFAALGRRGI